MTAARTAESNEFYTLNDFIIVDKIPINDGGDVDLSRIRKKIILLPNNKVAIWCYLASYSRPDLFPSGLAEDTSNESILYLYDLKSKSIINKRKFNDAGHISNKYYAEVIYLNSANQLVRIKLVPSSLTRLVAFDVKVQLFDIDSLNFQKDTLIKLTPYHESMLVGADVWFATSNDAARRKSVYAYNSIVIMMGAIAERVSEKFSPPDPKDFAVSFRFVNIKVLPDKEHIIIYFNHFNKNSFHGLIVNINTQQMQELTLPDFYGCIEKIDMLSANSLAISATKFTPKTKGMDRDEYLKFVCFILDIDFSKKHWYTIKENSAFKNMLVARPVNHSKFRLNFRRYNTVSLSSDKKWLTSVSTRSGYSHYDHTLMSYRVDVTNDYKIAGTFAFQISAWAAHVLKTSGTHQYITKDSYTPYLKTTLNSLLTQPESIYRWNGIDRCIGFDSLGKLYLLSQHNHIIVLNPANKVASIEEIPLLKMGEKTKVGVSALSERKDEKQDNLKRNANGESYQLTTASSDQSASQLISSLFHQKKKTIVADDKQDDRLLIPTLKLLG
jgi:hypothetical protein